MGLQLMKYAIVQTTFTTPSVPQLEQAFATVPTLTAADAAMRGTCFGIIIKELDALDAQNIERSLVEQGVPVRRIDQRELSPLPAPKGLNRADVQDAGLTLYDLYGRPKLVDWPLVRLIAAGSVNLMHYRRVETDRPISRFGRNAPAAMKEFQYREDPQHRLVLEIFIGDDQRYNVRGDEFSYDYLGPRLTPQAQSNYVLLVRDLVQRASDAWGNRGAATICQTPPSFMDYPFKKLFDDENTWLLWKAAQE